MKQEISTDRARDLAGGRGRELPQSEFRRIAKLLQDTAGIELSDAKLPMVHSRLSARLKVLKMQSYGEYCNFLESNRGSEERLEMLSVLTTNVTRFFREPHHFDYMRKTIVPTLVEQMRQGRPARIWSAGCSTGEEPYSIALTFLEKVPNIAKLKFSIYASDIDPVVLEKASTGIYRDLALSQVPSALKSRYFRPVTERPGHFQVSPEMKQLITFKRLNLMDQWPFKEPFDLIMCRNVVIYFAQEVKDRIWPRFLQQTRPGGWLITGHSERLPADALRNADQVTTTGYRRHEA